MKYKVFMGSVSMTYVPSFIKFGSGIEKLIRRDILTHRQHGDYINLLQESRVRTDDEVHCI
jgi:hypothetical protein